MHILLAVAGGGALGALARYGLSLFLHHWLGRGFPWGTLAANVLGSFLIGLLAVLLVERLASGPEARALILIGFLGSFTTFSSFSLETWHLVENGLVLRAGLNIGLNLILCLAATLAGLLIGRQP